MRYLSIHEVLELYWQLMERTGTRPGRANLPELQTVLDKPRMRLHQREMYPTLLDKATVLGFSLISGKSFTTGNECLGHAAMETFLVLNGHEIRAPAKDQAEVVRKVAAGQWEFEELARWLCSHLVKRGDSNGPASS